jgi:hypothetical protein
MTGAFGADDVAGLTFRKLRFLMIANMNTDQKTNILFGSLLIRVHRG